MGVRHTLLVIIILGSFNLAAQENISFAELDKGTYELYQKGDWKGLKELGLKGLEAGIDYYFLRMRLGISYYETRRYDKASTHFRKALEFSYNDPVALEYLYYSLLYSGRDAEARLIASKMPEATRKGIGIPAENSITSVFIEGGQVAALMPDSLLSNKPAGPYVYHYLLKDYMYFSGGISKNTGPRFNITAAINHMRFNALQEGTVISPFTPFPQYYDWEHKNQQTGFYLGSEYLIRPGLTLGIAGHIIGGKFNYMWFNNRQGMGQELFSERRINYSDYVINAELGWRFSTFRAIAAASMSDLGNIKRFQPGIGLNWYPLGNLNFYLQSRIDGLIRTGLNKSVDYVMQGLAGVKIFSKLWFEAHAATGRMEGWSEKSAYIVYNNQDPVLLRIGANLIIPDLVPGFSLTFRYQRQHREHSWEIYNGDILQETETEKYLSNSLIGGIIWKF